ncbi:MAG: hypothetical protein A2X18_03915 [Bacteroidetes bacterium GWF2_40_14]|nr:MAG: hypothetical protein A2X18_03915 [Bacteroidetes bacterium GWF2_40_14]
MKCVVLNILFSLLSISVFCQEINLKGMIIDKETKEPLSGANIFLLNNWRVSSVSLNDGSFLLKIGDNQNKDSLIISYIGYREKHIAMSDIVNEQINIELVPLDNILKAAVVSARRIIAEEFTIKQLKQMDIYMNPAAKADPLLAVNAMPTSTTTDESASISLRGSRPEETGIFLNDVPIYDAIRFSQLNGIGTFSIFNTAIIERMHVFAGNPPLEYGNTASGLVSLQTNNNVPKEDINNISLSFASFGALTSRKTTNNTALTAFANYSPSEILTGINQDALKDLKKFNSLDLGLHFIYNINSKTQFKLFNYSNKEGYEYNFKHPSYTGISEMGKRRNFTVANFISRKEKSEFTINAGYSISTENYNSGNTDISVDKEDLYLSANIHYFLNKVSIKAGMSFDYRQSDAAGKRAIFDFGLNPENPTIKFESNESYFLPEFFVYAKINLSKKIVIGSGIRKNVVFRNEPDMFSYQLNMRFSPDINNSFTLSAGHYNRLAMPGAEQISITRYHSDQLSLDYSFTNKWIEIQSSLFLKYVIYLNSSNPITGGEIFTNIPIKPFEIQLSLTSLTSTIKEGQTSRPSIFDLDYFFRGVLKCNLKDNLQISAMYILRQGCYFRSVTGASYIDSYNIYSPVYSNWNDAERLPQYGKFDITASKYLIINENIALVVFGSVSNLLNSQNVRSKNYNSDYSVSFNELYSKRTFYFGVNFIF